MVKRGRARGSGKRGEASGMAKLTEKMVLEIRERYAAGSVRQVDLASEYGVTQGLVSAVTRGCIWTHV
jgi:hypothetical protein